MARWAVVIDDPEEALGRQAPEVMDTIERYLQEGGFRYDGRGRISLTACVDWSGRTISIHDRSSDASRSE